MTPVRRTAAVAALLYLVTHVTAVAGLALYGDVLDDPDFVLGSGSTGPVLLGGFLEVLLALAVVGTAVTLYPVVRRQSGGGALGYVALRTLEASVILGGVVTLLAVVTLRDRGAAGATDGALVAVADGLVAVHGWTFLVGPGLVCGVNTLVLALLLLRSGLVPRWVAVLGVVGGPLVLASNTGVLFGLYDQLSPVTAVGAVPVFAWEISLAVVLLARGFRPAALVRLGIEPARAGAPAVPVPSAG